MPRISSHQPVLPAQRRLPGFVLLDAAKKPIYYNAEALRILSQAAKSETPRAPGGTKKALRALVQRKFSGNEGGGAEFISGEVHYRCRMFSVFQNCAKATGPATGLLIEASRSKEMRESELAEEFRLSKREEETVSLLTLGLTSKEIALRMGVSPNTIKVFLRLIMTKMAVNTRSGIIGKLLRN